MPSLLGQALTEAFVVDLDDVMREMTFGDLAVPREVKRATAALFDRHRAYSKALERARGLGAGRRAPRAACLPLCRPGPRQGRGHPRRPGS